METTASTLALPQFLRFLSTHPSPADVAIALARGPLARYRADWSVLMATSDDEHLRMVGSFRLWPSAEARYQLVPTATHLPLNEAFRDQRIVAVPQVELARRYPLLGIDQDLITEMGDRGSNGFLVNAPITSAGRAIGVWGWQSTGPVAFSPLDMSLMRGIGAILGVWLSHPSTPVPDRQSFGSDEDPPLALTDRQQLILTAVLDGMANPDIAARLGYSVSTVKQEVQRAMRTMRARDRVVAAERAWELGLLGNAGTGSGRGA